MAVDGLAVGDFKPHRQHRPETGGEEPGEGKSGNHYQLAKPKALVNYLEQSH